MHSSKCGKQIIQVSFTVHAAGTHTVTFPDAFKTQPKQQSKKSMRKTLKRKLHLSPLGISACIGSALFASGPTALAQAETGNTVRMERIEKENADLKARLDAFEQMAMKEGLKPSANPPKFIKALSEMQISGFVTASYFYDTSTPPDQKSNGYLWNTSANSFSINKVKLTVAGAPIARDKWDATYRASLIWGEDAAVVNTGGEVQGLEELREAYVQLNVPIGTGLDIKAGQLISLLNYESGDGGAANANFSQGYQWFYTGNGPSAGVQAAYAFNDMVDVKFRVQNGIYAGAIDGNTGKAYMGSIGLKPVKDLWISLVGFQSHETPGFSVSGASLLAGYQMGKLGLGTEIDYFIFDPSPASDAIFWSVGGWLTYDFTPKVGLAIRAEYLDDKDGFGVKGIALGGRAGSAILSGDMNGDIASLAVTLNLKPVPNVKIQPEIRYDHTSYKNGYDGVEDRFLIGAGISYLF
jgi:hypothetical protein